jgi:transposase
MTQTDSALVSGAVIVGVDTHKDVHVAVALDVQGRRLGCCSVPTTSAGLLQLEQWSIRYGTVEVWGVEGTGSYGAGLTRQLVGHGHRVREVSRPERKVRRDKGKSDLIDAELAARSVLAGTDLGAPKETRTTSESLRVLRATRRSAVKARTQAANLLHALLLTAPGELRSRLEHGSLRVRAHRCARLRPTDPANPADATKMALRSVAQRWLQLTAEIRPLESAIERLTQLAAPDLRAQVGVGADVAAALLIAVGSNPDRLVSEASFAALCGVSPIPASSGKDQPPPPQPRRRSTGQRRPPRRLPRPPAARSHHSRLPHPPHRRRAQQERHHALPHWGSIEGAARTDAWSWLLGRVGGWPRCRADATASFSAATLDAPRPGTGVRDMPDRGPNNEEPARASTPWSQPLHSAGG